MGPLRLPATHTQHYAALAGATATAVTPAVKGRHGVVWRVLLTGLLLFGVALWPRLSVPPRLVTVDEPTWLDRAQAFADALSKGRLERTNQVGHPGVTALWSSVAGMGATRTWQYPGREQVDAVDDEEARRPLTQAQRGDFIADLAAARRGHAVVNALLIMFLGLLSWRLVGVMAGALAGGLLALDPFLVAHAQVIRMDSLQAGFLGLSLFSVLIRWWRGGSWTFIVFGGVTLGLATLSKLSSLLIAAPLAACAALQILQRFQSGGRFSSELARTTIDLGVYSVVALLTFFAGWPALWVAPASTITSMLRYNVETGGSPHELNNFFLGRVVQDPGPEFYPVALLYHLTPIMVAGLVALAVLGVSRGSLLASRGRIVLCLALTVGLFILPLGLAAKKLDRYLLPVWPALVLLSAVGIELLIRALGRKAKLAMGLLALLVGMQLLRLPPFWPYAQTYYNPMLGGASGARQNILIGWGEGLETIADYLNRLPNSSELVVTGIYPRPLQPNIRGQSVYLNNYARADYLVDYVSAEQRQLLPRELQDIVDTSPPLATVELEGVRFASLYPLPRAEYGNSIRVDRLIPGTQRLRVRGRSEIRVRWTQLQASSNDWQLRAELIDENGTTLTNGSAPLRPLQQGRTAMTPIWLQPRQAGTYRLALSVLDRAGQAIRPTSAPSWLQVEPQRIIFPAILFQVY